MVVFDFLNERMSFIIAENIDALALSIHHRLGAELEIELYQVKTSLSDPMLTHADYTLYWKNDTYRLNHHDLPTLPIERWGPTDVDQYSYLIADEVKRRRQEQVTELTKQIDLTAHVYSKASKDAAAQIQEFHDAMAEIDRFTKRLEAGS